VAEDYRILRTLRQMAWQRAKGELHAVLETYWGRHMPELDNEAIEFKDVSGRIYRFIQEMDSETPLA